MPKIPTYSASIDYKPPRGDLETAAMPGQMLARFGAAAGEFGGKIARQAELAERMKQAAAEATRANGTAQAMAELRQTVADFDADTDPGSMMDRYLERAHGIGQSIADGIGDPQVRAQVEQDISGSIGVQSALIQGDSLRRLSAKGRQDLDSHLVLYRDIAADAPHPLEHNEAVDLAVGAIRRKAEVGFLTAADAANLEQTFYADVSERQARHAIAADPQSALTSLRGGEDFATLPAARRARLIDEADRAVQAQAVAQNTAAAADRRALEIRLPGFSEALRNGELPDDGDAFSRDSLIATFGDQDGARHWAELEDSRAFGKATTRVKWATPAEITRLLDQDADAAAPDGAASEHSLLRQAVERRNEQLWSRPADYVLANPRIAELHAALHQTAAQPKIPAALTAALQISGMPTPDAGPSDEDRRAATEAYANAALAEQARLGLPEDRRQVLPKAMAQELVARILDSDTKAAADTLSEIIANWGDAAPIALADLDRHGLPGEYRLLASLIDPAVRQTFAKVLTAQATEPGALRSKAGNDAERVDGMLSHALDPLASIDLSNVTMTAATPQPFGLDRIFPPVHPDDAADRSTALAETAARLGRHISRPPLAPQKPNAVPVYLQNGQRLKVVDAGGRQINAVIPDGWDLGYFAFMGERLRARDERGDPQGHMSLSAVAPLILFSQGLNWDLQRIGASQGKINREFRPISSVAIGVYGAAAGIPFEVMMEIQNSYAWIFSTFDPKETRSVNYPNLPENNVENTKRGYDLYSNGDVMARLVRP